MKHAIKLLSVAFPLTLLGCLADDAPAPDEDVDPSIVAGEAIVLRDNTQKAVSDQVFATTQLMTFHGGTVLTNPKARAIFWGSQWTSAAFAGDKITGIDAFFSGYSGTRYAQSTTEYTGTNGRVTSGLTYLGHTIDTTAAPQSALTVGGAISEACKITGNNPDPSALYLIYTSTSQGNTGFCAWHSWGSCSNGRQLQVAYMPHVQGQRQCDPTQTLSGANGHSQGLTALANVTAHELDEAITDPRGAGWFDASNAENGDKCAWAFGSSTGGNATFTNGTVWLLQGEWSNAAFNAGTGYPNRAGELGCLPR